MSRFGWLLWALLSIEWFVLGVGSCVMSGQSLFWWPAWAWPLGLSLALLIFLRRLQM